MNDTEARLLAEALVDLGLAAAHGGISAEEAVRRAESKLAALLKRGTEECVIDREAAAPEMGETMSSTLDHQITLSRTDDVPEITADECALASEEALHRAWDNKPEPAQAVLRKGPRSLLDNLDDIRAVAEGVDGDDTASDLLGVMSDIARWAKEGIRCLSDPSTPNEDLADSCYEAAHSMPRPEAIRFIAGLIASAQCDRLRQTRIGHVRKEKNALPS